MEKISGSELHSETMHLCSLMKDNIQTLQAERNRYVYKRHLDYVSDGEHLTSFLLQFQIEGEAK